MQEKPQDITRPISGTIMILHFSSQTKTTTVNGSTLESTWEGDEFAREEGCRETEAEHKSENKIFKLQNNSIL